MRKIAPHETEITGQWVVSQGRVIRDENCERIEDLAKNHFVLLGHDWSGWRTLYRDPDDNRLWELIYPESGLHGGGPPALRFISDESARLEYGDIVQA
jgi:hypothetical protein